MMKRSKYNAQKVVVDGVKFASKKEARRWQELKELEAAEVVSDLRRQVIFELIPKQLDEDGRVAERAVNYVADFVYRDKNGNEIVEDSKGKRLPEYIIKRKLMLFVHKIKIFET